ncbi:hypothetical protein FA592_08405 [Sulfurospirillum diekertiae]|uniref:Uncharacterized protein n=1 Tax=Sulfurospirillum diekertiae TaxID=1854492 RepID=A0A6G9VV55_9BACT|nr:hypothetical protein [Sulfurospirillum diekertiae]QIR76253.1 hypothetical protein FA584_08550 [Sulfurospirillum diekertiae]QIR78884.1 hypothetical protein FA592_08405 [Sulfurospirillum diekertiae]
MESLKDIKGLVSIPDFSWMVLLIIILCILGIFGWFLWKMRSPQKMLTPKEEALIFLKTVSMEDAKECAYALSQWGALIVDDTNRAQFEILQDELSYYKYRSYEAPLKVKEKVLWQAFLGMNDVHV